MRRMVSRLDIGVKKILQCLLRGVCGTDLLKGKHQGVYGFHTNCSVYFIAD
jgi:hypothetical protein